MHSSTPCLPYRPRSRGRNLSCQGSGCGALPLDPWAPICCLLTSGFREEWGEDLPALLDSSGGWHCWGKCDVAQFELPDLSVI